MSLTGVKGIWSGLVRQTFGGPGSAFFDADPAWSSRKHSARPRIAKPDSGVADENKKSRKTACVGGGLTLGEAVSERWPSG